MPSTNSYVLRLLNPVEDSALYHEAYHWRSHKPRAQPDRMSLEDFAAVNDTQLTVGLFNGELQAVYHLIEVEPSIYEAHFTSRRNVPRGTILAGARQTARLLLENGATQIHAWVVKRNTALRGFLEDLGFTCVEMKHFPCQNPESEITLSGDKGNQPRLFVKYVLEG